MGQHARVRGNGGAFTCHSTRPSLGPGLLLSPIAHEPCTSKPTSPPPPPNCQPSAPTPARPSQPPQKVADPLETHRLHTPRAGSGVNRRNRRARIDQAPPEEGHSNCCEQEEGVDGGASGGWVGWAGEIEAPSRGRSVMGSCACVLVDSIVVATLVCTLTLITMEADSLQFIFPCYRNPFVA